MKTWNEKTPDLKKKKINMMEVRSTSFDKNLE
jgi:hypothetical protein